MMLMLFLGSNVFAKGYRIVLPAEKGDTAEYLLSGWKWGDKVALDTVRASKGKISFRGKSDLACGSYEISELSGRKLVEFIVPRENRNFGITFQKEGEGYTVKRGNAENRLFSGFLYFLDYGQLFSIFLIFEIGYLFPIFKIFEIYGCSHTKSLFFDFELLVLIF